MEWIISFLFAEMGMGFWIRQKSNKLRINDYQEQAFMALCFGFSVLWYFIILADYYVTDENIIRVLLVFSELGINLGVLFYIYNMEKIRFFFLRKFFLTKLYLVLLISYVFVAIFFNDYASYHMSFNVPFFIGFIFYYIYLFHKILLKKKALSRFTISIFLLIVGVMLLMLGFLFTVSEVRAIFGWGLAYRFLGDVIQLIAAIILIGFLILVPTTSEFDWEGKIESIILMLKNGLPIYSQSFGENSNSEDNLQVSGTITTMKMMLDATLERKGVSIIEKKGKTMIIMPGEKIYGIIICTENLLSLQILLKILIQKVENLYGLLLNETLTNLKIFKPIDSIVNDLFF